MVYVLAGERERGLAILMPHLGKRGEDTHPADQDRELPLGDKGA